MELNPNHPLVRQAHGNWHKLCALLMVKQGLSEIAFTLEDVKKLEGGNINIVLDARGEAKTGIFKLRLVDDATADRLSREHGGRPEDS